MAYDPKNLSVLAYANGFTLWHYRTTDQLCDVLAPGYFAPARDMLRVDDRIMISAVDAAADAVVVNDGTLSPALKAFHAVSRAWP